MNAYLVVHLDMPPVSHFDPRPIAARWFKQPTEQGSQHGQYTDFSTDPWKIVSSNSYSCVGGSRSVQTLHTVVFESQSSVVSEHAE